MSEKNNTTKSVDDYLPNKEYVGEKGFHSFEKNGEFYFGYNGSNGYPILRSEGYSSAGSRDNGIESVKKNAPLAERYMTGTVMGDKYHYFALKAGNHQEIARSVYFGDTKSMASAFRGVLRAHAGEDVDVEAAVSKLIPTSESTPEPAKLVATSTENKTVVSEAVELPKTAPAEPKLVKTSEEMPALVVEKIEDPLDTKMEERTMPEPVEEVKEAVQMQTVKTTEQSVKLEIPKPSEPVVQAAVEAATEEEEEEEESRDKSILVKKTINMDEDEVEEVDEDELVLEEEDVQGGSAHDDYDWDASNKYGLKYSSNEIENYTTQYESTLSTVIENQIVSGLITAIHDGDVVLDINFKSDGLIALSEFRDMPDLGVGDHVDVYVEQQEDERGQLVLSRRKAKLLRAWESIKDSFENGTVIKGVIIHKTKGGLIADCSGLETFLPGSQIDIKPIIDYDSYVGKTMEFKVVKINEQIKNAVVSHKALIESDLAEQREQIIASLERGQVLEGLVKNLTDFGAFLDLGGVDGLLYITDISWGRISHPSEILSLNDKINVVVLDFDENKKRISLGLKQLQPHPWEVLDAKITEGSTIKGKVVNIEDYGAFLEIEPGVEGLVHVSEVTWSNQPVNARDYFKVGNEYDAKVVTIDREDRKMSLSIKQLSADPWETIEEKFPIGSRHTGRVKNLTPYGVFVELGDGIGGMIHVSDLSWTKRYSHPSEFTKVNDEIDLVVLEIDKHNRKMSLGHKQIEENPWDTFENVFPVGSYHEATVLRRDDRGAIVQLPYGLEAYAPLKHIRKEDGSNANADDVLTVKVIEFNRDDKRILVSHLRYLEDIRREADQEVRKQKDEVRQETKRAVKKQQSGIERSTLGDLDIFSDLKEQLEETATNDAPATEKPAVKPAAPVATAKAGNEEEE